MARIEDYAVIGDTHSAALVSMDGSIDWLCLPRFDSDACFAALLDEEKGGRWRIAPKGMATATRAYHYDSLVLETTFETDTGRVSITDCLPLEEESDPFDPRGIAPEDLIVRVVTCRRGSVEMAMDFSPRFDFANIAPWLRRFSDREVSAVGGPDALDLYAEVPLNVEGCSVGADFELSSGESVAFIAAYRASHVERSRSQLITYAAELLERTDEFWRTWVSRGEVRGEWRDLIVRSLLTLKALTYSPTGGIVAAATTSIPELIGGVRNWDYRYCWLRDATFTLEVLLAHGYEGEAIEWRDWLLRAVAGDPDELQIMYGVMGERRLYEHQLDWLAGYENSRPVRTGNQAAEQMQLDVYGEVMDSFHSARRAGIETTDEEWALETEIVEYVCETWRKPDNGIWEARTDTEHHVHSKVMAWVAIDRGISAIEKFGKKGPIDKWKAVCEQIHDEIMEKGVDKERNCFVRAYGDPEMDASLLILPIVGFCAATDEVMTNTIEEIQKELTVDGFIRRYRTGAVDDGLPPGEGTFLLCTFWMVDCLALLGRDVEARELFDRLLEIRNDVGLFAEQYDTQRARLCGNFPQAFSHIALATAASVLADSESAMAVRRGA